MQNKGYFQPQQAREVASAFAKHKIDYMFIGKSGAILLGYPSTTQDVDLFPKKSEENCRRLILALADVGFQLSDITKEQILRGIDFVQINQDPFDIDLVFAPDGIDSFEEAQERMIVVEDFHVASLQDIIASKRAAGREKDLVDLPLLEDFRIEYERSNRRATALETTLEKVEKGKK